MFNVSINIYLTHSYTHSSTYTHTASSLKPNLDWLVQYHGSLWINKFAFPLPPHSILFPHTHTHTTGLCKLLEPAVCNMILQQLAIRHYTILVHWIYVSVCAFADVMVLGVIGKFYHRLGNGIGEGGGKGLRDCVVRVSWQTSWAFPFRPFPVSNELYRYESSQTILPKQLHTIDISFR